MTPLKPDEMTVEKNLQTTEALRSDLCTRAEGTPSPEWHADVLAEREAAVKRGEETFEDWEAAKKRILDQTR